METNSWGTAAQFYRYFISGITAVSIHLIVLVFLVEFANANATASTGIGFCLGSIVNYAAQYFWVFNTKGSHKLFFCRYVLVTSITFSANLIIFYFLYEKLKIDYFLSQVTTTSAVFIANFIINKYYTFERQDK